MPYFTSKSWQKIISEVVIAFIRTLSCMTTSDNYSYWSVQGTLKFPRATNIVISLFSKVTSLILHISIAPLLMKVHPRAGFCGKTTSDKKTTLRSSFQIRAAYRERRSTLKSKNAAFRGSIKIGGKNRRQSSLTINSEERRARATARRGKKREPKPAERI